MHQTANCLYISNKLTRVTLTRSGHISTTNRPDLQRIQQILHEKRSENIPVMIKLKIMKRELHVVCTGEKNNS
jgi:hypothetical protein